MLDSFSAGAQETVRKHVTLLATNDIRRTCPQRYLHSIIVFPTVLSTRMPASSFRKVQNFSRQSTADSFAFCACMAPKPRNFLLYINFVRDLHPNTQHNVRITSGILLDSLCMQHTHKIERYDNLPREKAVWTKPKNCLIIVQYATCISY